MEKKLCKLRRHDIADSLGEISQLVAAPEFFCSSCARSSSEKSTLCKPVPIAHKKVSVIVSGFEMQEKSLPKKIVKLMKKEAKKQKKYQKKQEKAAKRQEKIIKKHLF